MTGLESNEVGMEAQGLVGRLVSGFLILFLFLFLCLFYFYFYFYHLFLGFAKRIGYTDIPMN